MTLKCLVLNLIMALAVVSATAQDSLKAKPMEKEKPKEEAPKKWYDLMKIAGYAQVRYNRLLETNPNLTCEQCDRSIGNNGGVFIRRARVIFSGKLNDRIYYYVQPDFATNASGTEVDRQNFLQIRDFYFDVFLDKKEEFRFRIGQSKEPYGFDNLQSRSRRANLDRSDALNSAAPNERDLGLFFYYSPASAQAKFKKMQTQVLKGTGDYGMFAFGVYNGQSANVAEANNNLHVVARFAYPFETSKKNFEVGLQAYTGKFGVYKGVANSRQHFKDERVGVSAVMFPQPFGFAVEYNVGNSPRFDLDAGAALQGKLKGGYALVNYAIKAGQQIILPFARFQYYDGGKKHETDARSYTVYETEFGLEWQPVASFELTAAYNIADRTYIDAAKPINNQYGSFLRLQAQVNF